MAYRRRYRSSGLSYDLEETSRKVSVTITWDLLTNAAYRLKFDNIGRNFSKIELVISVIKTTIPTSQYEYDRDTKIWYIGERYIKGIKDICDVMPEFEVIFNEKPDGTQAAQIYTKDAQKADYEEFKRMLSFAHIPWTDTTEFSVAKKAYLRAASKLHPDINPNMAAEMTTLNATWSRLTDEKHAYFKKEGASQ